MLLMQAQDNGVALDEEQLLFIAGGQDTAIDEDVDEQPVQDLALNVDNVFQADDCDAFDYDINEAPMAQTMFMANLSSADRVNDEDGPSYDSNILSEYVKDNTMPVVHIFVSSIPNDAYYMMIYNDMYEPHAQSVSKTSSNTVVENSLTAELATYKEHVELHKRRVDTLTIKLLDSCMSKVDSKPPHGSNTDTTNPYECKQTLDSSAGTSINVEKEQTLHLGAGSVINKVPLAFNLFFLANLYSAVAGAMI
nr:retrovirus-related Pol polyprotein from transposon TNT 1-94 [Tanacetum cinerariifolium]GEZ71941.1 retrovirus-related Pol polyprotein from transposon TNT 1-94 [Tanacetum cinerariifolium]